MGEHELQVREIKCGSLLKCVINVKFQGRATIEEHKKRL